MYGALKCRSTELDAMVQIPRWFLPRKRGSMTRVFGTGDLYGFCGSPSAALRMLSCRCSCAGMKWPLEPRSSGCSPMILISCATLEPLSTVLFNSALLEETVKCRQILDAQHAAFLGYKAHLLEPGELAGHGLPVRADPACDFFMGRRRRQ